MFLRGFVQDLRYSWRQFTRAPTVIGIATLTLAIGVGANAAIFSLLDTALLQTLPVHDARQLRTVQVVTRSGATMSNVPSQLFAELRKAPQSFSGVFAFWRMKMNLDAGGDTSRVLVQFVSGGYYSTLGVRSFWGRLIDERDERNHERVAVLSHSCWTKRFSSDSNILGKTIRLNGTPTQIIGVTPPAFFGTDQGISPDLTIPLEDAVPFANVWTTVRLQENVSEKRAQLEADLALQRALNAMRPALADYRESDREEILSQHAVLTPGDKGLGLALDPYTPALRTLMLLSGAVLLIACVNIANVLMARFDARSHETGVRLALGASRRRLVQQFLTESAFLAIFGVVASLGLAFWIQRALVVLLMDRDVQQEVRFRLDVHILLFSAAATIITLVLFGLVPALRGASSDVSSLLKPNARGTSTLHLGLAKGLIVTQIVASLLLLSGAGLLVRSFRNLAALDVGMPVENILVMRIGLDQREGLPAQPASIYQELAERIQHLPGVSSVALGWDFAFASGEENKSVWVEGQPPEQGQSAEFNVVGPGFFSTVGIPLVYGREFTRRDVWGSPKVVIINQAFANRYFPSQNPIGRHLGDEGEKSILKYEVIGVVADSRNMSLKRSTQPVLYQALLQDEWASNVVLHVRTAKNPLLMQNRVRSEIRALNPNFPVYDLTTLRERRSSALRPDRMLALLASFFGCLALLLSAIGIYGVISYAVGRRTREIGVRLALGATRAAVLWMIVRETLMLVAVGAAFGLPLSFICNQVLKATLFGVAPQDALTASASLGVLVLAGTAAAFLPARRAALLQPASTLRAE